MEYAALIVVAYIFFMQKSNLFFINYINHPMGDNVNSHESDDIFDDVINIEQKFYDQGRLEGEKHGIEISSREGKIMGHKHGIHIGSEFGYYQSCVDTWVMFAKKYPNFLKSSRIFKSLIKFQDLIESTSQLSFKEIIDQLPYIKTKFKQLSLQIRFNDTLFVQKTEDEKMEF